MVNNEINNNLTKKRNRILVSCTECHRRKQKCDRAQPCKDCVRRGLSEKCKYRTPIIPTESGQSDVGKTTKSRMRRIMTGEEVLLTPESVDDLAILPITSPILPTQPEGVLDLQTKPVNVLSGFVSSSILSPVPTPLAHRPKWGTVSSGGNAGLEFRFLGGSDPFSAFPGCNEEPVPKQLLIHYYVARLCPWLCYLDDALSDMSPRLAWLPFAMGHLPLFYATLLTAAVHLNRRRPLKDPSALIWFKVQTIKMANEAMIDPAEAASDQMIIVALVLLYFNVGGGNTAEYEIHLKGINDMLKIRGGKHKLGMRGMVKNWLAICHGPWSDGWEDGCF